jgi:hypothetical protein
MSEAARNAIAQAASTAEGITCHPYFVQGTKTGHATVRLDVTNYPPDGFGGVVRWNVVVMLPQDQAQAEKYIDDHLKDIVAAVSEEMQVSEARPQQLNIPGAGILPVLFITGHREQE